MRADGQTAVFPVPCFRGIAYLSTPSASISMLTAVMMIMHSWVV